MTFNSNDRCFYNKITCISVTWVVSLFNYIILGSRSPIAGLVFWSHCILLFLRTNTFLYISFLWGFILSLSNLQDNEYLEGHCSAILPLCVPHKHSAGLLLNALWQICDRLEWCKSSLWEGVNSLKGETNVSPWSHQCFPSEAQS